MLASHLKKILADKVVVSSTSGVVVLKEQRVQKVEVSKLASDAVVVKLDRVGELSGLDKGPWKQVCDYLLVYPVENRIRVLFVELKKTLSTNRKKAFEQLRWSLPLLKYLGSICELHLGPEPEESEKEVKYILICDRIGQRIDKQSVKAMQSPYPMQYKDIIATIFIGPRFSLDKLWNS